MIPYLFLLGLASAAPASADDGTGTSTAAIEALEVREPSSVVLASALDGTVTSTPTAGIEELEVRGTREPSSFVLDPTASRSRISSARIQRGRQRGEALPTLLDGVAGVRVLDLGGPVSERRLTIRGSSPAQAALLVDGLLLRSPFSTGLDVGLLHLDAIDEVEVLRGGAGASLGDGALAGAVSITTRAAGPSPLGAATLTVGSFQTTRVSAVAAHDPVLVSAAYEQTAGDFDFTSRLFGLPDRDARRINNDARRLTLAASTHLDFARARVRIAGGGSLREAGVPGFETPQQNPFAREERGSAHGRAELELRLVPGSRWTLGAGAAVLGIGYSDRLPSDPSAMLTSDTRFFTLSADARGAQLLPGGHLAGISVAVSRELSISTVHGRPSRMVFEGGLSDEVAFSEVTLFGAVRAVSVTDQAIAMLPRAGVRWDRDVWSASLGAGRSLRTPALDELYHPPEAGLAGNPDLRAETAWEADADVSVTLLEGAGRASVSGFARTVEETILWINRDAFTVRPENVGASRAVGGELELSMRGELFGMAIWGNGSGSLLRSVLSATGEPLPTQPAWNAAAELGLDRGIWAVSSAVRFVGPTSANLSGTLRVPVYARWDAAVTVEPAAWIALSLNVLNLADDRGLASVLKLPLPGRSFFASIRLTTDAPAAREEQFAARVEP